MAESTHTIEAGCIVVTQEQFQRRMTKRDALLHIDAAVRQARANPDLSHCSWLVKSGTDDLGYGYISLSLTYSDCRFHIDDPLLESITIWEEFGELPDYWHCSFSGQADKGQHADHLIFAVERGRLVPSDMVPILDPVSKMQDLL